MYEKIKGLSLAEQVEVLTRTLVTHASINGTEGETRIADEIKKWLLSFPYFKAHPELVWEQVLPHDPLGRKNIFALVKGKPGLNQTVIYHSHLDTVGIEDFGALKDHAFDPDYLETFFKAYSADPRVQQDALSGDYLFGRGSVDMKSGIAVHLANILRFSQNPEELNGNLLLMINPVEENQHTGIIEAIKELKRLKEEEGLSFVLAINNDFTSSLYDQDPHYYIYTGAVGKLLPCFYISGREAHVGETLTGVDPTLIASEINRRINNNMDLAEEIEGELILPPSCLYLRDQKDFYNVQTAGRAYLYFNLFLYRSTPETVLNKLKLLAVRACQETTQYLQNQYQAFIKRTGYLHSRLSWDIKVYTYEEYVRYLKEKGIEADKIAKQVVKENKQMESRQLCFKIMEALEQKEPDRHPKVILFFAPPYCPHNYLDESVDQDRRKLEVLQQVAKKVGEECKLSFMIKHFFPYLSDSSYLSLHETDEELQALVHNFPQWEDIYPLPFQDMRKLDIPSINMGVYGHDAHQWTERVYKPYSFSVLPQLIKETTLAILNLNETGKEHQNDTNQINTV
ncbi:protein RocB [Caldalkalibacillus thermarum]|uniref:M20/M25/M40 family metallo-hydrolase n=1 Tax=Caldalkalibacillus thermarum TaxID=296745 RepID=UPI001669C389|nr:M20/M25/M40 family metallo-hydrolase [Caldalkalibacillus thermarum]GGK34476.1 protein RocB [Caldalkalibacillus thermarum]